MAYGVEKYQSPEFRVGVDVMKVQIPQRTTFTELVQTMNHQVFIFESNIHSCEVTLWLLADTYGDGHVG